MNSFTKINEEIETLKEVIAQPDISAEDKAELQETLKELIAKKEKISTPKKTVSKAEIYAFLSKEYPYLTKAKLPTANAKFTQLKKEIAEKVQALGQVEKATETVAIWLNKLPKGVIINESTPTIKSTQKVAQVAPDYDWRKPIGKTAFEQLMPIRLECDYRAEIAEKKKEVIVKMTAEKGDYIVFNGQTHPVMVLTAESAAKRCKPPMGDVVKKSTYDAAKEEIKKLNATIEKLKADAENKSVDPPKKTQNAPSDESEKTKPKAATKSKATKKTSKKKRSNCTLKAAEYGKRANEVVGFLLEHAAQYKDRNFKKKILSIYRTKGENQLIIMRIRTYAGAHPFGTDHYYKFCVDSQKLTKTNRPKRNEVVKVVQDGELKQIYTTGGDERYDACLKTFQQLLKCSLDGNCTGEETAMRKKAYNECGDLILKKEILPEEIRAFHREVKRNWKKNEESYKQAVIRTAELIEQEKAKTA